MKYARFRFNPVLPLGDNNSLLTGCKSHLEFSRKVAGEGMVLLKNNGGALPLNKGEKVAVFGKGSILTLAFGGGSGEATTGPSKNVYDGLEEKEKAGKVKVYSPLKEYYQNYIGKDYKRALAEEAKGWVLADLPKDAYREAEEGKHIVDSHVYEPDIPDEIIADAALNADTAVITLDRYTFEGHERKLVEGDYYLSETEKSLITRVGKAFKKTVLVLNIGGVIDCEFFAENDDVDAVLCSWFAGTEGGLAIADILCGDVNPSGKLVDTFAKKYEYYPCSASRKKSYDYDEYFEDIYVGYRYFETIPGMSDKVRYPFGFGLSYTNFETDIINTYKIGNEVFVDVSVKNIGDKAGKETLQLYYSAPQGLLGKPKKQLITFKKTPLLNPNEKAVLVLSFNLDDMASFDDLGKIQKAAKVLEKGEYTFHLGNCINNTVKLDFVHEEKENRIVEQLHSYCSPRKLEKRLLADGTYEKLPKKTGEYPYPVNKPFTAKKPAEKLMFWDVTDESQIESFMAQISDEDMAHLLSGKFSENISLSRCFGGNWDYGIPKLPTVDGPAGIHGAADFEGFHVHKMVDICATAIPCGICLACSFDTDLMEEVGKMEALEVKENNFGVWLAPAINIHRDPLCGRNFEYYSEDPVVTGMIASAVIKGIQSRNIGVSLKHFACNNMEYTRFTCDSRVSERAMREIYLKAFEMCVKNANPWTIMSSYNLINGVHASECYELLTGILRDEWGFKGMVTTDWGIKNNPVNEVRAGNDMKMPFGYPEELIEALKDGRLTRADMEVCLKRILTVYLRFE